MRTGEDNPQGVASKSTSQKDCQRAPDPVTTAILTAPVQPGNSGGPGHDYSGNVVGVVLGKLDADKTRQISGAAPENVNFAISEWAARSFRVRVSHGSDVCGLVR